MNTAAKVHILSDTAKKYKRKMKVMDFRMGKFTEFKKIINLLGFESPVVHLGFRFPVTNVEPHVRI